MASSSSNLLLTSLNLVVLLLSSASLVPILLLKNPPTGYGWALAAVSIVTILSSSVGFYSRLSRCCFLTHVTLVLASIVGQALGFSALFLREELSLEMLGSRKGGREVRVLYKAEEGVVVGMFLLQSLVLALTCAVQSRWVREYEGLEVEGEKAARRRSRKKVRVQVEAVPDAPIVAEKGTGGGDERTAK